MMLTYNPLSRNNNNFARYGIIINLATAIFIIAGCLNQTNVLSEKFSPKKSRQIAEEFVRSQPDYISNDGRDLVLLTEEPLRCPLCWVFDFRYVVTLNGMQQEKYITVTVQEGKPSKAIHVREGLPPGKDVRK